MKGYLLDTHILLWAWHRPQFLSKRVASILSSDAALHVSLATFWEIAIKVSSGKLDTIPDPIAGALETNCRVLDIRADHIRRVEVLPLHHRDPFDRMLIAQAAVEDLVILTADRHFAAYGIDVA